MNKKYTYSNEFSVVLAGEAGQGVQTIELILTKMLKLAGYNVFATKEYMSRVRGGTNSTEIRIASHPAASFVDRIDIFLPFSKKAVDWLNHRISDTTIIAGDKKTLAVDKEMIDVPFLELAKQIGNPVFANSVALGFAAGLLNIEREIMVKILSEFFADKGKEIIDNNTRAGQTGWDLGQEKRKAYDLSFDIHRSESAAKEIIMNGHQAVALNIVEYSRRSTYLIDGKELMNKISPPGIGS
ncbi:2-oxoacid:acceptor oxidoreductase family protein [Candidatus Omnitrophota bacterium]